MSVQSYDDRFNDIQNLILTIEQRYSSSTKLIALAQQCSEEIRSEAMQKIDSIYQDFKAYRIDSNKLSPLIKLLHREAHPLRMFWPT
jgi:hypothetical protein